MPEPVTEELAMASSAGRAFNASTLVTYPPDAPPTTKPVGDDEEPKES